jgi:pilus assembly protein TadC
MPGLDDSIIPSSALLTAAMFGAFVSTALLVLVLTGPNETPAMRLTRYVRYARRPGSPGVEAETVGLRERLIVPTFRRLIELAARAAPSRARRTVAADLQMAGSRMNPTMFLGVRTMVMFGLPICAVLYVLSDGRLEGVDIVVLALALIWGRRLPTMWLKRRIRTRQKAIDRSLPYTLDLMVACLEGGLSLDASLAKVVEQTDGPLAVEIRRSLQEMALGRPTSDAIRARPEALDRGHRAIRPHGRQHRRESAQPRPRRPRNAPPGGRGAGPQSPHQDGASADLLRPASPGHRHHRPSRDPPDAHLQPIRQSALSLG